MINFHEATEAKACASFFVAMSLRLKTIYIAVELRWSIRSKVQLFFPEQSNIDMGH
jgi:hypothetical protein